MKKTKTVKQFYTNYVMSKSELFLSLVALILALVILFITLVQNYKPTYFKDEVFIPLGIGSNLPLLIK